MFFDRKKKLIARAKMVLDDNWKTVGSDSFTIPSQGIYPFQWNWDSAFHVYGYMYSNVNQAISELRTLYKGQWRNGMLPHMIFHENPDKYVVGPDFWKSQTRTEMSPRNYQTSGITQPPIQAIAIWDLYEKINKTDSEKAHNLLLEFFPKLMSQHRYFFNYRDPEACGIVTIYHPWESGMDNSPRWDSVMSKIAPDNIDDYVRNDINFVDEKFRPGKLDYDRYIYLAMSLRGFSYDDSIIHKNHDFLVKDIFISSVLYSANLKLKKMAEILDKDTSEINKWINRYVNNIRNEKYFDKNTGVFCDYNVKNNKSIKSLSVAGVFPYLTDAFSKEELHDFIKNYSDELGLTRENLFDSAVPSVFPADEKYEPEKYWRGPVWININWMVWKMLDERGEYKKASKIKKNIIKIISKNGFNEYFSNRNYRGLGAENFSWTASLLIDFLNE